LAIKFPCEIVGKTKQNTISQIHLIIVFLSCIQACNRSIPLHKTFHKSRQPNNLHFPGSFSQARATISPADRGVGQKVLETEFLDKRRSTMSKQRAIWTTLAALFLSLSLAGMACAQDNGGGPPPGGQGGPGGPPGGAPGDNGGGGGRRRFDPQQMMQYRMNQVKEDLGASDDEWTALQPKVQKVMEAQMEVMRGRMRGRRGGGGFNGPPGGGDQANPSAVEKAMTDLQAAVNSNAAADDLKNKLQALRDARAQAMADMTKAQADLKSLLTQRQEAQLVLDGVLE
jgi:hypothetical protein